MRFDLFVIHRLLLQRNFYLDQLTLTNGAPMAVKRLKAFINASVSSDDATAIWIARDIKQMKRKPYLFNWLRLCRIMNESKQSAPTT